MTVLAAAEQSRLDVLERTIERGLETFIEVGKALAEIRDSRLYRARAVSFEAYCAEVWNMSRPRAYQLIEAAEVVGAMSTTVDTPTVERHARELAPLKDEPEKMREAWAEASSNGTPTAEKVREAVRSRMGVHYSSATPEWETPQDLFDVLNAEFGFTLDVCATDGNRKCAEWFSPTEDGLAQDWHGTCWMNPPYGDAIADWVQKAYESSLNGTTVVCLVPARTDTGWWWDHCRFGEVRFLKGRLRFGGSDTGAPFPSAVVVFDPRREPDVVWWEWR